MNSRRLTRPPPWRTGDVGELRMSHPSSHRNAALRRRGLLRGHELSIHHRGQNSNLVTAYPQLRTCSGGADRFTLSANSRLMHRSKKRSLFDQLVGGHHSTTTRRTYCSRNSRFNTLPIALRGNTGTISTSESRCVFPTLLLTHSRRASEESL
jgi:hypothetical protein